MQKVLAVMNDLFFSAKINDAAKTLGMTTVFVKDNGTALEQLKSNPALVILDLNCATADPLELIRAAKEIGVPTLGFISHVQIDLKQQAQAIGCDTVLARSVFAQNLPALMAAQVRAAD